MKPSTLGVLVMIALAGACNDKDLVSPPLPEDPPPGTRFFAGAVERWQWLPDGNHIVLQDGTSSIQVVDVTTQEARTLVPAGPFGHREAGFSIGASYIYYRGWNAARVSTALYRKLLDGSGEAELLLDSLSVNQFVTPSHDERMLAWVEERKTANGTEAIIIMDIASGIRERFTTQTFGWVAQWAPDDKSIVVHDPFNDRFVWLDRATKSFTMRFILANPDQAVIVWVDNKPRVRRAEADGMMEYNLATSTRQRLVSIDPNGYHWTWTTDLEKAVVTWHPCARDEPADFDPNIRFCVQYGNTIDLVTLHNGTRRLVEGLIGSTAIEGQISPNGSWFAFEYGDCVTTCPSVRDGLRLIDLR